VATAQQQLCVVSGELCNGREEGFGAECVAGESGLTLTPNPADQLLFTARVGFDVVHALHLVVAAADVARLELTDSAVRLVLDRENPLALDDAAPERNGLDELSRLEERVLALVIVIARHPPLGAVDGVGDGRGVGARDGHDADI